MTERVPAGASLVMVRFAVRDVALPKVVLFTVIVVPENETLAPETKSVPAMVTFWLVAPAGSVLGLVADTVGGDAVVTLKQPVQEPERPPGLVTPTSRAPGAAVPAMVTLTVSSVLVTNVVLLRVMPAPEKLTSAPGAKLAPRTVRFRFASPAASASGLTEATPGAGAAGAEAGP